MSRSLNFLLHGGSLRLSFKAGLLVKPLGLYELTGKHTVLEASQPRVRGFRRFHSIILS